MKPQFDEKRPMSWSQISSFEYDHEQWYQKYVLGKEEKPTPELVFGKKFADACEARKPLAPVTLLSVVEHPFTVTFDGIALIGFADTFCGETRRKTGEFKTGAKPWDQKRVDEHGQITMYAFMHYIKEGIKPEECEYFLEWIPTRRIARDNGDFSGHEYDIEFVMPIEVKHFTTKRTMVDVLNFASRIKKVRAAMKSYALAHA